MSKSISFLKKLAKVILGRATVVEIAPLTFSGWKMATGTQVPWYRGGANQRARSFAECDARVADLVARREVLLTQFRQESVDSEVAALKWRHYFVHWTASEAACLKSSHENNFVELGVCDGLTAWYAALARQGAACEGKFYLYDAWAAMRDDLLTESEKTSAGSYAYLSLENTKKNLSLTGFDNFVFNKGYIPESFITSENPETVAWLHIDLNSALPTLAALDYFWGRMVQGGIVLFDDFSWPGYEDAREKIEAWSDAHGVQILHLPTGQATITKKANT
jgi:O-methyltransferase